MATMIFSLATSLCALSPRHNIMGISCLVNHVTLHLYQWFSPLSMTLGILASSRWLSSWSSIIRNCYFRRTSQCRTWYLLYNLLAFSLSFFFHSYRQHNLLVLFNKQPEIKKHKLPRKNTTPNQIKKSIMCNIQEMYKPKARM